MKSTLLTSFAVLAIGSSAFGQARVLITEIMYNPNSEENQGETEWIEIANVGTESIALTDWRLDDESKRDWEKFTCTLAPGGVTVLVNAKYVTEEQFRAAWDEPAASADSAATLTYQIIPVKWGRLGNSPSAVKDVLQLRNDKDEVVCEVKQEGKWPSCSKPDGPSLALIDISATTLNNPKLWTRSEAGKRGARKNHKTDAFNGEDSASPGYVEGLSPAPKAPAAPNPPTVPGVPSAPDVKPTIPETPKPTGDQKIPY